MTFCPHYSSWGVFFVMLCELLNSSAVFAASLDEAFILFMDRNVSVIVEYGPLGRDICYLLCILIVKLVLFYLKDKVTSAYRDA